MSLGTYMLEVQVAFVIRRGQLESGMHAFALVGPYVSTGILCMTSPSDIIICFPCSFCAIVAIDTGENVRA